MQSHNDIDALGRAAASLLTGGDLADGATASGVRRALHFEGRRGQAWQRLRQATTAADGRDKQPQTSLWSRALRVAAVLIPAAIVAALAISTLRGGSETVTYAASGQADTLLLPDGSQVVLGKGSTLTYTQRRGHRETHLEGLALFAVTHDERAPFTVEAGEATVTVLGTRFSVEHWPGEQRVRTRVESGRVGMAANEQRVYLGAGETGTLDDSGELRRQTANLGQIRIGSRIMEFHGATLQEVAEEVLSCYHDQLRGLRMSCADDSVRISTAFRDAPLADVIAELNMHFDKKIAVRNGYLTIFD